MNNEELSIISEKEFEIEYQKIKSKVIENKSPVDCPVAVVLGGQPGAGKSNIYDIYRKKSNNNIVELDCDTANILKYLIEYYCSAIFIRRRYFTEGPGRPESPVDSAESKPLQY